MRKLFTILIAVLCTASVFAQSPEKMSYQAVIRDASDNLVTSQSIGMQISILHGSASGTAVYVETQTPTTNANGLVSIEIGTGTLVSGDFTTIDWANGPYFIKTETDPTGGTTYTITGTSQLLSVPYALHAKTAETVIGGITETDPVFNAWDKSTGISITESQISDLGNYIETENDPTYTSSQAANITATDIANLGNLSGTNTGDQDLSTLATKTALGDSTAQVRSEIPDVSGFLTSETDPVFGASVASSITVTDTTNWNNKLDSYTETQTLANVASLDNSVNTQLKNVTDPTEAQDATTKSYVDSKIREVLLDYGLIAPEIGEFYAGGIVFYIFQDGDAGYIEGEIHGLVCAVSDQSTGIQWYNGSYTTTGATGTAVGTGQANTTAIVNNQGTGSYAAQVCNDLTLNGYSDWFLPSKEELNLMYQNKAVIEATSGANGGSGFASTRYWSSTELNNYLAWRQIFDDGGQTTTNKLGTYRVRAVRAF